MSESSRLGAVVEIDDLADDEAIAYLTRPIVSSKEKQDKTLLSSEVAKEIVAIVGGRMRLLKVARTDVTQGKSIEGSSFFAVFFPLTSSDIRQAQIASAEGAIRQAKLSLAEDASEVTKRQRLAWSEIVHILDSSQQEISTDEFVAKVGGDELADDLLRTNVFSYHHNRRTVGIQTRPMQLYLSAKIGAAGSPQRTSLQALLRDASRRPSSREDI